MKNLQLADGRMIQASKYGAAEEVKEALVLTDDEKKIEKAIFVSAVRLAFLTVESLDRKILSCFLIRFCISIYKCYLNYGGVIEFDCDILFRIHGLEF